MKKKLLSFAMAAVLALSMTACTGQKEEGSSADGKEKQKLVVAYQSSIAYAPIVIMKEKGLVEKAFEGEVEVDYQILANGAAINDGITSGAVDVGALGVAPAITGVQAGIPYRIFAGISSQPYAILTNQDDIKTLSDITAEDQIAITGINSHPHILLAKAAKEILGDAKALDANLVVLANPDGYTSIVSGAVNCHMVISPYNFMEEKQDSIHEIEIGSDIWPEEDTFIVGVASTKLKEEKPELYKALCDAMEEAMKFIKENPEETAEIISRDYDATAEEVLSWMSDPASNYATEIHGAMSLANFMVEEGFLENGPKEFSDLVFDNVKGN